MPPCSLPPVPLWTRHTRWQPGSSAPTRTYQKLHPTTAVHKCRRYCYTTTSLPLPVCPARNDATKPTDRTQLLVSQVASRGAAKKAAVSAARTRALGSGGWLVRAAELVRRARRQRAAGLPPGPGRHAVPVPGTRCRLGGWVSSRPSWPRIGEPGGRHVMARRCVPALAFAQSRGSGGAGLHQSVGAEKGGNGLTARLCVPTVRMPVDGNKSYTKLSFERSL